MSIPSYLSNEKTIGLSSEATANREILIFRPLMTNFSLLHISIFHFSGSGVFNVLHFGEHSEDAPTKMPPWSTEATQAGARIPSEHVSLRASSSCMLCPRQRQPLGSCSWDHSLSSCGQCFARARFNGRGRIMHV